MQVDGHCQRAGQRTEREAARPLANHLRPGIKKEWTRDEEELIKDMHLFRPQVSTHPRWICGPTTVFRPVSSQLNVSLSSGGVPWQTFQNRSDNDIKNKWYSMMQQKRISDQLVTPGTGL
jgi:hypothetical protein